MQFAVASARVRTSDAPRSPQPSWCSVNIVVEPSDYLMRNIGDMAMLQAAVARMVDRWPDARIDVFTDDPEGLVRLAPGATPASSRGRNIWLRDEGRETLVRIGRRLPIPPQERLRVARPGVWFKVKQFMLRLREDSASLAELERFHSMVTRADLVIVTGMGGVTDAFPEFATGLLDTLALARHAGRYTAMIGQGFGPLQEPRLRALASAVLPRVDLIAVREERASVPLLLSLGVSRERIVVTGDDTLEPAYRIRPDHLGNDIGVNLRIADYSGVDRSIVPALRAALGNVARRNGAELVPVPISRVPGEADLDSIRLLIGDVDASTIEGSDRPEDAMRLVHGCRVVVTGSYHSAVFALASGIPAVGLAGSPYYEDKFKGLSDLFGDGCETLMTDEPDLARRLEVTTERLFARADELRPAILKETERQIGVGRAAFARLADTVEARAGSRAPTSIAQHSLT
jgi:polysaccharide pyruvyl transferase WcaK-like protein